MLDRGPARIQTHHTEHEGALVRDRYVGPLGPQAAPLRGRSHTPKPATATLPRREAAGRRATSRATGGPPSAHARTGDGQQAAGARERRLIAIGFVLYAGVTSVLLVVGGYFPSIDMLALAFFPIALVMRRGRTFLADWVPFAIVLLAYEQFRGLADAWTGHVHVRDVIAAERLLFGSPIPTVRLQQWFHDVGQVGVLDVLATGLYFVHFVGVIGLAFWLWLRAERRVYWRYVLAVLALSYAGFATYALFPAMPPRLAAAQGALPPTADIFMLTVSDFSLFRPFFTVYQWIDPNPYAAMPSLHIAYPMLVFLVARRLYPRPWTWAVAAYPLAMTLAVVYLAHHYVVDCIAGALYAWIVVWVVWDAPRLVRYVRKRRHAAGLSAAGEGAGAAGPG